MSLRGLALCVLALACAANLCAQLTRLANTTIAMPQTLPVSGYTTDLPFSSLAVNQPTCIVSPPGETNRLFVLEKTGDVVVITNLAAPTRTVFMRVTNDLVTAGEAGLLGMAFHPGFATNKHFYLFYMLTNHGHSNYFDRLSRFEVDPANPNRGLIESELPLFSQEDDTAFHNAGDLHFGPDGYLYISMGDEGAPIFNVQRIDRDLYSAILRIDVDRRATNLSPNVHPAIHYTAGVPNYFIPADNPFIGATSFNGAAVNPSQVRTEFWAVGFRNPWRFTIDEQTGVIYCADVGEATREEIDVVLKGGNYGWNYREGSIARPGSPGPPAAFSAINPIADYGHGTATNQGNSVIGGIVYRGQRFPELHGAYVFADVASGHIWYLRSDGSTNPVPFHWLATEGGIAAFAADPRNGDILLADHIDNRIRRLIYSTNAPANFPARLSDTGVFSSLTNLAPHPGVVPYDINVHFWSDNARKTRWFSVPDTNATLTFAREGNWSFPTGTVWVKHFDLELTNGVPSSSRRLETRLLVKNSDGVYGVTYRWGTSLTNATLVPPGGMDEAFVISEGGGILRTQVWRYPSRSECLSCHTPAGGFALGFNTAQLNRHFNYAGGSGNQIRALANAGYFSAPVSNLHTLHALAPATNAAVSLEYRVRSYLAANCQQCHQPGGGAPSSWDARIETPLSMAGIIDGVLQNPLGDASNRVVVRGDRAHSVLLRRISENGPLRMPPLGSSVLDTNAMNLLTAWIESLTNYQTYAEWQLAKFGSTTAPLAGANEDFDGDGAVNFGEYLLATDPTDPGESWKVQIGPLPGPEIFYLHAANCRFEVQFTTNLQPPIVWQPLDAASNAPFISATNFTARIPNAVTTNASRFYRVVISEP